MGKYLEYTNEDIINAVPKVKSIAGLLRELGLKPAGGNYHNIKRKLQILGLECPHWTGQAWNKGERLKDWNEYTKVNSLKPHLIRERGYKCQKCNNTIWLGEPISLDLHHVDGNHTNNNKKNLLLLCPNCHAQTKNYKGRNNKQDKKTKKIKLHKTPHKNIFLSDKELEDLGKNFTLGQIGKRFGMCSKSVCKVFKDRNLVLDTKHWKQQRFNISKEELKKLVQKKPYTEIGKMFGVSGNTIKKRCKRLGIEVGSRLGYWTKQKKEHPNLKQNKISK